MIERRIRLLTVVVACLVVAVGCTSRVDKSGGEVVSRPLVLHGISTRAPQEIQPFVDQVAKVSNGSIGFEFDADWHKTDPAADAEAIQAVSSGAVSFAVVPVRAWHAAGVLTFDALIAPMVIDSYSLQEAVLQDGMADQMLSGVGKLGLTGIGILPGPMREPAGITRDLLEPLDFDGARIAVSDGAIADRSLRQLGATAVPSAFNGAEIGGFDGIEQQVASIESNVYDRKVRSVTANVNLWPRPYVVVGNSAALDALSDAQRAILMTAAKQAVAPTAEFQEKEDRDAAQGLCNRGRLAFLTASPTQLRELRDALLPVDEWLALDGLTNKFLHRIQQLRAGLTGPAATINGCAGAPSAPSVIPSTAAAAIDGRWEVSYTREEFAGAGPDPGEADVPDNWGTFQLEFRAGRFSIKNVGTGPTNTGDYVLNGDLLTLNVRTTGELFAFRCSRYRDTLSFAKVPGSASPTGLTVKPWTRLPDPPATTPTR